MSSVDEIRGRLGDATLKTDHARGALIQALLHMGDVRQLLEEVAGNSAQPAARNAIARCARSVDQIGEAQDVLQTVMTDIDDYVGTL